MDVFRKVFLAVVSLAAWTALATTSDGAMLIVNPQGAGAEAEIQATIDAAEDGDTVVVKPGEYLLTEPLTFAGKAITLIAEGGQAQTMLRAMDEAMEHRALVRFESGEPAGAVLEGFTLTSGVFFGEGSSPTLRDCLITGSGSLDFELSGVFCDSGSAPTLVGCTITRNTAGSGGGLYCAPGSAPTLTGCTISRNFAYQGGGVFCDEGSSPVLRDCMISYNCCRPRGGGGGLFLVGSTAVLENCTIVGNLSTRSGGGVFSVEGAPILTGCTIAGNLADEGGGVFAEEASSLTLTDSVVWDNTGGSLLVDEGSTQAVTYSCVQGDLLPEGVGNINADPLFCGWESTEISVENQQELEDALDFNYALGSQSPCLGTGEGGENMGADLGMCDAPGAASQLIQLAAGNYSVTPINLWQGVSLQGVAQEETVLEGTVRGLRTGASLASLTVNGEIEIETGEGPEIVDCTITGGGVRCREESTPTLRGCTVRDTYNGVECGSGASPTLVHCAIQGNSGSGVHFYDNASPSIVRCTITANEQAGIGGYDGQLTIESSIIWENGDRSVDFEGSLTVTYSCVEGDEVLPGEGNINADPLFCGWESAEVSVSDSQGFEDALDFNYALSGQSPCLGTGQGGENMGADLGLCDAPGAPQRLIRLAAGTYAFGDPDDGDDFVLLHDVNLVGAGQNETIIASRLRGLSTGTALSDLTLSDGATVCRDEAPELTRCTISGDGVHCDDNSTPQLTDCLITANRGDGVHCSEDARPVLTRCTITANSRHGVNGYNAAPVLRSCIVWNNLQGAFPMEDEEAFLPEATYSCIEGTEVWPGEGNINADPLFCGWESEEVAVADPAALRAAVDASSFSLALSTGSPCLGSGENGTNMGADTGTCDTAGINARRVALAPGTYATDELNLFHKVHLVGSGSESTVVTGHVEGLPTGTVVSDLTVSGGMSISDHQAPEFERCTFTGGYGVHCDYRSAPRFTDCLFTRSHGDAVHCGGHSTPVLVHCTIAANGGRGVSGYEATPVLTSCIVWDNNEGSLANDEYNNFDPEVTFSCVEGASVWPGEGNINADPLFCGWETAEVAVASARELRDALETPGFSLALSTESPCLGTAEGGADMGADLGVCEMRGTGTRRVLLGPGTYSLEDENGRDDLVFLHDTSLVGAGEGVTIITSRLRGPSTGTVLSDLTLSEGVDVFSGQAPNLVRCTITGYGLECYDGAAPRLTDCLITGNEGDGVHCGDDARPVLTHCTITENLGVGLAGYNASAELRSCIVWDNAAGSISQEEQFEVEATYSCIEAVDVWPGEGNINASPLFCGWESEEVAVDNSQALEAALDVEGFSLQLSTGSPCLGAGEGGSNMGVDLGVCKTPGSGFRRILLAPGNYSLGDAVFSHDVHLLGAGQEETNFVGLLEGLSTGTVLSDLTISGGLHLRSLQSPELVRCRIFGAGVRCSDHTAPRFTDCLITGNSEPGVVCHESSAPRLTRCTITANFGSGVEAHDNARPVLRSCIVWDNVGGSFALQGPASPDVQFSCIEAREVWPGEGNINADPEFCGWPADEPLVDGELLLDSPAALRATLNATDFSLSLAMGSPCLGTGEGGVDMGADLGMCDTPGNGFRRIRLAPGTYAIGNVVPVHNVSIAGSGEEETVLVGEVLGLSTGNMLSDLTLDGRLVVAPNGAPDLVRCTISGEGVTCEKDSTPLLADCTITGSSESGVSSMDAAPLLTGCVISGSRGSGLFCFSSIVSSGGPTLINCVLSENDDGGALTSANATLTLFNCTVAANNGAGLRMANASRLTLTNTLVWDNAAGGIVRQGSRTPTVTYSNIQGNDVWSGEGNILADPLFAAASDYHLRPGSEAIDAGTAEGAPATDLDGKARPCGITVDIGAYEFCDDAQAFIRGDCDGDGNACSGVNDALMLLGWLFRGDTLPPCVAACDSDASGEAELTDAVYGLDYCFKGTAEPPAPFPECGPGTETDAALGCVTQPGSCQ